MVPATLASIAMHCVQAHTRCMNRLSVRTEPLVRTFAIDAISPNASNRTDKLEASSNKYNIPVSSFSMVVNCFMVVPFLYAMSDAKGLLAAAIRDDDLVMFFENKMLYAMNGEVPEGEYVIPLGKADIKREGMDVTVVAISRMVHQALAAADALQADGISIELVDPRTLSPLDEETILTSVAKTHRLVIVDEDNPRCSAATDIAALVVEKAFTELDAPIKRVTAPHTPVPFSPPLEQFYVPSPERIVATIQELLG